MGPAHGATATCSNCSRDFRIAAALSGRRPRYRLYAKLVLDAENHKEYLRATEIDTRLYAACDRALRSGTGRGLLSLPTMTLADGHNTRQAITYGFTTWRDFFNSRQLLALTTLKRGIESTVEASARGALLLLFSGTLEFNNMFASYKGEGTGAVRHMFSHHILRPERMPLEANVWGTPFSSGSFSGLYRSRLLRALWYRQRPSEIPLSGRVAPVCSTAFSGRVEKSWPRDHKLAARGIYLSCGDSADSKLADESVDLVVTDPPFFDNVHYSELADFFYAWQRAGTETEASTTRRDTEVQDVDPARFARKLTRVFKDCHRVLRRDGLLVFTYHHSRPEGWTSLRQALAEAGFVVTHSHPVRSEMTVAAPKSQAKAPIQVDVVLVCRKSSSHASRPSSEQASLRADAQARRLGAIGLKLSANDIAVIRNGQLLTAHE